MKRRIVHMPQPSDLQRLEHIRNAIQLMMEFTASLDNEGFLADRKTQLSIERLLEIIGEAATHISIDVKSTYPTIPWRKMSALRNVVSHEYFQVRAELIWGVVTTDIPQLAKQIQQIMEDRKDDA